VGPGYPDAIEDEDSPQVDGDLGPGNDQGDRFVDRENFAERGATPENLKARLFLIMGRIEDLDKVGVERTIPADGDFEGAVRVVAWFEFVAAHGALL
jgi:hypothetical protein